MPPTANKQSKAIIDSPTNSVKALKAKNRSIKCTNLLSCPYYLLLTTAYMTVLNNVKCEHNKSTNWANKQNLQPKWYKQKKAANTTTDTSNLSSLMRRRNAFDPATLHRSPMLMKFVSGPIRRGSKPTTQSHLSVMCT